MCIRLDTFYRLQNVQYIHTPFHRLKQTTQQNEVCLSVRLDIGSNLTNQRISTLSPRSRWHLKKKGKRNIPEFKIVCEGGVIKPGN